MTIIPVCLIEQNILFREGVKSLLQNTDYAVRNIYSNWQEAAKNEECIKENALFIVNSVEVNGGISSLKQLHPASRVIVFADSIDLSLTIEAFTAGSDAFLLRSILPRALIGSMDMVMGGERIWPTAIINMLADQKLQMNNNNYGDTTLAEHDLSSREIEVLRYLSYGESNKQIARNLDITEGTVKGHIKTVLRKLDVSNRTQAAIWAVNKGLGNNFHANAA